ncbi:MAG: AAA domain-containing protein [Dehalococcoidia bacterium]|nr:AAA domain-containing protein [Dehalococcoidia bacterium]
MLGQEQRSIADADPHALVNQGLKANEDQTRALRRSLGSDTTFIWGPPGTGKTYTLALIVEAHYRAGRSVLLVSNTNIAVDTALERVAERLQGEPGFNEGLVIRQGPVVKEELRQRFGPYVILEEIVARLGERPQREKNNLLREAALLEAEERSLAEALEDLERLAFVREELAARQNLLQDAKSSIAAHREQAKRHHVRAAKARSDLERARATGAFRRLFLGLEPERLLRDATEADHAAQKASEAAQELAARLPKLEAEIAALRGEEDRLIEKTRGRPSASEIQGRLDSLGSRLDQIRERIRAIERELADLERRLLAGCKILATTVYRTYLGNIGARLFDVVVIDEASMLMLPLVYHAAGLAKRSVTVAGDFRQLPPIVLSRDPLAAEWLKRDIFEKDGIPEKIAKRQPIPHLVALGTQYRMQQKICELVNELFYSDCRLRSESSVYREIGNFPFPKTPLLYVNTGPFHPRAARRARTYSRYNIFHALLARNIVSRLADAGFLPHSAKPNDAIGVVAPYAAQARLIQTLLNDCLGARAAGIAATAHRFQGNEKDIIVLDLTDSYGVPLGRFLRANRIEEDGARLMNVAVSRARKHLIVLGNFEYLRKTRDAAFVLRLLDYLERHGEPLDLDMLLPLADRDWVDGLRRALPATFDLPEGAAGAFTERTFYPAFLQDLNRARKSIVIFSPFATENGTARWIGSLRAAVARKVEVRLVISAPKVADHRATSKATELARMLRELGIAVDFRENMHEKIAMIDGRILWHGSLNILSHRGTRESMLRLDSEAACRQLSRYLGDFGE